MARLDRVLLVAHESILGIVRVHFFLSLVASELEQSVLLGSCIRNFEAGSIYGDVVDERLKECNLKDLIKCNESQACNGVRRKGLGRWCVRRSRGWTWKGSVGNLFDLGDLIGSGVREAIVQGIALKAERSLQQVREQYLEQTRENLRQKRRKQ